MREEEKNLTSEQDNKASEQKLNKQEQSHRASGQEQNKQAAAQSQDRKTAAQHADAQRRVDPARRPHRASGPQIYGQSEGMANPQIYGQQGMIRRDVPARGAGQPINGQVRAQGEGMNRAGQPINGQVRPQGEGMSRAGQPINGQGRPQGELIKRMEIARTALKSPVFLLIALLNTVFLVGSVAAVFLHQMNYSQFVRLISDISMPAQLTGYMETLKKILGMLDSGMLPVNLALQLPNLFLCIGLWLICMTVRSSEEEMSGAGFVCMKISVIIRMIVTCVVILACLILSVTLVVAAWVSGTKSMIVLAGVMLAAMIIIALAAIMYYFCYLATIKVCRLNASTGEPYGQVSLYVAVIHVVLGLSSIVGLLSGIVNAELSNIVGSIGKIGWMLLLAAWICIYKGKMSEFED